MIYLDNAATTKPLNSVVDEIKLQLENNWANSSSTHKLGRMVSNKQKENIEIFRKVFNCNEKDIIFTSGATESINMVLKTFWDSYKKAGRHIITCSAEHYATLNACKYLEKNSIIVTYLPIEKNGEISLEKLEQCITDQTSLFSFIFVNNEIGSILNIEEIIRIRNKKYPHIKIHLDSVQALGKIDIDFKKLGADYYSFSSHKLHGPKGVGMILKGENAKISPLFHGGGQQSELRSGTMDVPSISGFALAAKFAKENIKKNYDHVTILKKTLLDNLTIKNIDYICNSPLNSSPYIVSLSFRGIKGEVLVNMLESYEIYISKSSACKSSKKSKNHVLEQLEIKGDYIDGSIRISFSSFNTVDEVLVLVNKIDECIKNLSFKKI